MMVIANRSSTTARVSRNARRPGGRCEPTTRVRPARTRCRWRSEWPSPRRPSPPPLSTTARRSAPGTIPPSAAAIGRAARLVAEVTGDELPFELQAHHEEEDGQQAVAAQVARFRSRCQGAPGQGTSRRAWCTSRTTGSWPRSARSGRLTAAARHRLSRYAARRPGAGPAARTIGRTAGSSADAGRWRGGGGQLRAPQESGRQESTRRPDFPAHRCRPYPAARSAATAGPIGRPPIGLRLFLGCRRCPNGRLSGWSCGRTSRRRNIGNSGHKPYEPL